VKRLLQRTEMRNIDSNHTRYTSLAWAAVSGSEETFDFLLSAGHDEEEISKVCKDLRWRFASTLM
jgi:ankyrin repeat protein